MKINQLKAGAALSYITIGLGYIISIIYTPIMLRLLGQSEYGLYNLVSSVVSYLGLLNFGFSSAYIRYYSRYKVKEDDENVYKLNGMFLIVFIIIGFIALVAGGFLVLRSSFIFGDKLSVAELGTAKVLMSIMVFNLALSFPASVFNSYVTANEKYIFQKLLQLLRLLVNPFLILPILLLGYRSVGMVVATTIFNIIVELINVSFCLKSLNMKFYFKNLNLSLFKEVTVFSSYLFMNMIIDQINWNVDKFLIGRFRGTIAVAVYGIGAQLNTYYISLSTSVSSVLIPKVNKMIATKCDNTELTNLFTRIGRIQFIILSLICSGIIFFGKPFITMWGGAEYSKAYPIALLLIVPVTIPLIQNIGIEIQKAKNMHRFRSWVYLLIAMGNVILSIPLTKSYGGFGAALGTAIALLLGNGVIMNWYYHYRVGLDMKYFWAQIFNFAPALILPTITGIVIFNYVDLYNVVSFLFFCSVYTFVYFASMWLLGMNKYEKDLIGKPVGQVWKKLKVSIHN